MGLKGFQSCEPLADLLLVRLCEHKETAGGLILPETASQEVPPWVEVLAIGPDVKAAKEGAKPRIVVGCCVYPRIGASIMRCQMEGEEKDEERYLVREDQLTAVVTPPRDGQVVLATTEQREALATVTSVETVDAPGVEDFPPLVLS